MKIALDFEYKAVNEFELDLVCVAWSIDEGPAQSLWLHRDDEAKQKFKEYLLDLRDKDCRVVCFNASAEAHGFISLGLNPLKFKWIDLQCEFKMQTNHFDRLGYGECFVGNTTRISTKKNYFGKTRKGQYHKKVDHNLATCTLRYLKIKIDVVEKNKMRDLIIFRPNFPEPFKTNILRYCESDVKELFAILKRMMHFYQDVLPTRKYSKGTLAQEIFYRGECSARAAYMEAIGIPLNIEKVSNLAAQVQLILDECAKEILGLFPDIRPFEWDKKNNRYKKNVKLIQDYIKNSEYASKWERTDTGLMALKLEAFTEHFSFSHTYPKDNFFAQMIRYLKLGKIFNGLKPPKKGAKSFFDSVGSDGRVRPYLNIYRAQSARFQPLAKSFPFLWAAWIRAVVEPKPGSIICGIDYSSQEFLISALNSKDKNMIEAYRSGDPYLYFGKKAGFIPEDGTKKTHGKERDIAKWVTLGISYGMTAIGLAKQLTEQIGEEFSKEKAQKLIDLFFKVYKGYKKYTENVLNDYYGTVDRDGNVVRPGKKCIKLPDGFYMFGDNDNERSVVNVNSQGYGSCILRKAIQLCQDDGLKVIMPLHDALYCEGPLHNYENWVDVFHKNMMKAFTFFYPNTEDANLMRLDGNIWGPDLKDETVVTKQRNKLKSQTIYIDDRDGPKEDYAKFSKYFERIV